VLKLFKLKNILETIYNTEQEKGELSETEKQAAKILLKYLSTEQIEALAKYGDKPKKSGAECFEVHIELIPGIMTY